MTSGKLGVALLASILFAYLGAEPADPKVVGVTIINPPGDLRVTGQKPAPKAARADDTATPPAAPPPTGPKLEAAAPKASVTYLVPFEAGQAVLQIPAGFAPSLPQILQSIHATDEQVHPRSLQSRAVLEAKELMKLLPADSAWLGRQVKGKLLNAEVNGQVVAKSGNWVLLVDNGQIRFGDMTAPAAEGDSTQDPAPFQLNKDALRPGAVAIFLRASTPPANETLRVTIDLPVSKPWSMKYVLRVGGPEVADLEAVVALENSSLHAWDKVPIQLREGNVSFQVADASLSATATGSFPCRLSTRKDSPPLKVRGQWMMDWDAALGTGSVGLFVANDQSDGVAIPEGIAQVWSGTSLIGTAALPALPRVKIKAPPPGAPDKCVPDKQSTRLALDSAPVGLAVEDVKRSIHKAELQLVPGDKIISRLCFVLSTRHSIVLDNAASSNILVHQSCTAKWRWKSPVDDSPLGPLDLAAGSTTRANIVVEELLCLPLPSGLLSGDPLVPALLQVTWSPADQNPAIQPLARSVYDQQQLVLATQKQAIDADQTLHSLAHASAPTATSLELRHASESARRAHQMVYQRSRDLRQLVDHLSNALSAQEALPPPPQPSPQRSDPRTRER